MVADADGVCVASVGFGVAKLNDAGASVVCVLGAALGTTPVVVTTAFGVKPTDGVNGTISVIATVAVGTLARVMALPAWIAGVTSAPVETVTDVTIVPDKADGTVTAAVPVRLLLLTVSADVAVVTVTAPVIVTAGVASVIATGVLRGSTVLSVVDRVAAAVSTAEIASPTLPVAALAGVSVCCGVTVNACVLVNREFTVTLGMVVAAVGRAAASVSVTALVLLTAVGKLTDDVLEIVAALVNPVATLMLWAGVIWPLTVTE